MPRPGPSAGAAGLLASFRAIVGARHVLTGEMQTRRYRQGYRFGQGRVLAVVRPGSLVEQWWLLQACIGAGAIVITDRKSTRLNSSH